MAPWLWLVIVVVVGASLLGVAALADRRHRRRTFGAGEPAPMRNLDTVDRHVPAYITQDEIDALPDPGVGIAAPQSHRGEGFGFGHAAREFETTSAGATWEHPRLLVVDGPIESMRELLAPVAGLDAASPLIIVAADFSAEVLATLAANRKAIAMPVVAARAGERDRRRLAELTGATALSEVDLQAGYVPAEALGHAARWTSTRERCWVEPDAI